MQTWQEQMDQGLADMTERHESERAHFEEFWRDEKPREYRRPTGRYLELKAKEKALAAAGEIDEAERTYREAERTAKAAAELAQERLDRDYRCALQRLIEKQQSELDVFNRRAFHQRDVLLSEREKYERYGKYRADVVALLRTKASKPKLSDEMKIQPAKRPRSRGISGLLLPDLIPPNDPERQRRRQERHAQLVKEGRFRSESQGIGGLATPRDVEKDEAGSDTSETPSPLEEGDSDQAAVEGSSDKEAGQEKSPEEAGSDTLGSVFQTHLEGAQRAQGNSPVSSSCEDLDVLEVAVQAPSDSGPLQLQQTSDPSQEAVADPVVAKEDAPA
jgi:hypothetical protein